jgi:hypothetical protein
MFDCSGNHIQSLRNQSDWMETDQPSLPRPVVWCELCLVWPLSPRSTTAVRERKAARRQLISMIGLDTFHSESRAGSQEYLFGRKIISYNDRLIEAELMDDSISRNPVLNATYYCQKAHRMSLYPGT